MADILQSIPHPVVLADYVKSKELRRIHLEGHIAMGFLSVVSLQSQDEDETALHFMTFASMDDGEAITGAIAKHRNFSIATDDAAAIFFFEEYTPAIQLLSTPEILAHWSDAHGISDTDVQDAIMEIERVGKFTPHRTHPYYEWWQLRRS